MRFPDNSRQLGTKIVTLAIASQAVPIRKKKAKIGSNGPLNGWLGHFSGRIDRAHRFPGIVPADDWFPFKLPQPFRVSNNRTREPVRDGESGLSRARA
jgi:hypothetical protein